jgi:AraC family transcriptional regulator
LKLSPHYSNTIIEFCPFHEGNSANRSRLTSISTHVRQTPSYGIKYVITGTELYVVNGKEHRVTEGQYLLVNKGRELLVEFNNPEIAEGICISLDETLLKNVWQYLSFTEEQLLDAPFDSPASSPEFNELVYSAGDGLSTLLKQIVFNSGRPDPHTFYHDISVELIRTQAITCEQIRKIKAAKPSTKKELFNRLHEARNILEADGFADTRISEVAREVALSEFHFLRSFKAVFGYTPHQYVLAKRLSKAMALLRAGKLSVTETAHASGFKDVFSFSKAFKKHFGIGPSSMFSGPSNAS